MGSEHMSFDKHEANEQKMRLLAIMELQRIKQHQRVDLFEAVGRNDLTRVEQLLAQVDAQDLIKHSASLLAMAARVGNAQMNILLGRYFAA